MWVAFAALACLLHLTDATVANAAPAQDAPSAEKIIIDTDSGDDIDDAFCRGAALRSPEFNILGITTAYGDTEVRARILDRMLGEAGRSDIPIAVGVPPTSGDVSQAEADRGPCGFG